MKKLIVLAALLFFCLAGFAVPQDYADAYQEKWYAEDVRQMQRIGAFPAGNPEANCSRIEFAKMLVLKNNIGWGNRDSVEFVDVGMYNDGQYAEIMASQNLAFGTFHDGERYFMPSSPITRAEVAAFLDRCTGPISGSGISPFHDIRPGDWYFGTIVSAYLKGIVAGYPGGYFKPNQNITRAEAAAMINRAYISGYGWKDDNRYAPRNLEGKYDKKRAEVELTWDGDKEVDEYHVYRDGKRIGKTSRTNYKDKDVKPGKKYKYYVVAYYKDGSKSDKSKEITVNTDKDEDYPVPEDLKGIFDADDEEVRLSWDIDRGDEDVDYFEVYRDNRYIGKAYDEEYTDDDYEPGERHKYEVSAVYEDGEESEKSRPVYVETYEDKDYPAPENLEGEFYPNYEEVWLSWDIDRSGDEDVDYFEVYRDNRYIGKAYDEEYTDDDYEPGERHKYEVLAVYEDGEESEKSRAVYVDTTTGDDEDEDEDDSPTCRITEFSSPGTVKVGQGFYFNIEIQGDYDEAEIWVGNDKFDPFERVTVDQPGEYTAVGNLWVYGEVVSSKNCDLTVVNE